MATARQERACRWSFPACCHDALGGQIHRGVAGQNNPAGIPTSTFGDFIFYYTDVFGDGVNICRVAIEGEANDAKPRPS